MKSFLSALALLFFCLVSWAAAETLTFQTLDGDTQQVNPDEIWRIRATSTSDEPPGAVGSTTLSSGSTSKGVSPAWWRRWAVYGL